MQESYSRITDWFKKKKPEQPITAEPEIKKPQDQTRSDVEGVVTDQKLLSWYYKRFQKLDTQPVATDKFMDKSKNEYNAAWLARELIQIL